MVTEYSIVKLGNANSEGEPCLLLNLLATKIEILGIRIFVCILRCLLSMSAFQFHDTLGPKT